MLGLFFCVYCNTSFSESDDWCDIYLLYIGLGKRPLVWDQESGSNPVVSFQGGVLTHWCLVLRRQDKLPRWFESTWGLGWLTVWLMILNWIGNWNCVILERSLVRNQESGVTQIRWRVEGGVLDSLGLDSMAAGVKCLGGSSPPKLFMWCDYVTVTCDWLCDSGFVSEYWCDCDCYEVVTAL